MVLSLFLAGGASTIHGRADFGLALLWCGLVTLARVTPAIGELLAGRSVWAMAMAMGIRCLFLREFSIERHGVTALFEGQNRHRTIALPCALTCLLFCCSYACHCSGRAQLRQPLQQRYRACLSIVSPSHSVFHSPVSQPPLPHSTLMRSMRSTTRTVSAATAVRWHC